jgi:hypothetical protein
MTGTLVEQQNIFMITSRSVFLRMRNVSDRFVEKIKKNNVLLQTSALVGPLYIVN